MLEKQIIEGLKNKNRKVINWIVKEYYPVILSMLKEYGGQQPDVKSLLSRGLQILIDNIVSDTFKATSSVKTYLYGICKNMWLNERNDNQRYNNLLDRYNDTLIDNEKSYEMRPDFDKIYFIKKLKKYFSKIGKNCFEILIMTSEGRLQVDIANHLSTTEGYIKKRKFKCLTKLKKMIKNDKELFELYYIYKKWIKSLK